MDDCLSPLPEEEEFGAVGSYTFEMCAQDLKNYAEESCGVCYEEHFEIQGKIESVIAFCFKRTFAS